MIYSQNNGLVVKKNAIVVGDIVEDAKMASPDKHDVILKVGILIDAENEHHLKKQITSFNETFDLIIAHDGSFCPLIDSLQFICGKEINSDLTDARHL